MAKARSKRGVAVQGSWQPVPLAFLRSRACAEMSPHASKLLLDVLSMLGPNATRNGDISLAPKVMATRGWSGRETLGAAIRELETHGLLFKTRQGGRLDCSLFACTLYPMDCDFSKLDNGPGSYVTTTYMGNGEKGKEPTEANPAKWRQVRKTLSDDPPRDKVIRIRPATGQSKSVEAR